MLRTQGAYELPKFLFDSEFSGLSNDARVLYALLRSRYEKGHQDENSDVYVYFRREEMSLMLGVSENTVRKVMRDLGAYKLLEDRQQGSMKPNRIYLL